KGDTEDRHPGGGRGQSPLVIGRFRGGALPARSWRDHPGACAVLCATPDMWGSRLLFGGYGTPALAAPREAGLLAFDPAVVAAEAMVAGAAGHDGAARTVGCFVNTVPMAVAVAGMLRARRPDGRPLRVVMVCGQIRPADLARLEEHYPGILSPKGSPDVDVIVATQSLEVGVDLDLAGIVTELAAGSAL